MITLTHVSTLSLIFLKGVLLTLEGLLAFGPTLQWFDLPNAGDKWLL